MSDEEKEALEILKDREYDFDELYCTFRQSFIKPYDKSIGIILELIEKQQKEIEELKEGFKIQEHNYQVAMEEIEQRWKDKIKAKIEEYEKEIDKLYKKKNWYEPQDTEKKNKFMHYIEFGQSLLKKE